MSKKRDGRRSFLGRSGDPIIDIFGAFIDVIINHGIKKVDIETGNLLGTNQIPLQSQLEQTRAQLQVEKTRLEIEKTKALSERQIRILDLRIQDKEIELEERRQRIQQAQTQRSQLNLPISTEIIQGALEIPPVPEGLFSSHDEGENYKRWLEGLGEPGKVYLILGRRGSGKTALAAKMAEYAYAVYGIPVFWLGLPPQARALLPSWIKMVDSLEQCPAGCIIIADEAGLNFLSLAFTSDSNILLRKLLMICRHRRCSLIFAGQSSRDIEYSIVREADSTIFKEPGAFQPDTERTEFKPRARAAAATFKVISSQEEKRQAAYVFSDDFQGLIKSSLPSFWSSQFSSIYSHLDLNAVKEQGLQNQQLQQVVAQENKLLDEASLDKKIFELRRQGMGIERIAKTLNVTVYAVRKVLPKEG
jgi:hypothetical protein